MNSEELERSLRSEFENYLNNARAEMRQEAVEFQSKVEAEVEKHKTGLNDAFRAFTAKYDAEFTFDDAFKGTVAEHIRLARDEGARITADALAEAEKLETARAAAEAPKYDKLRDAVADISGKDSQSAILKSLVSHAGEFAPRGAFFIIKSEHFVGWKVFGADDEHAEAAIREVHFSTTADTILGSAASSLATAAGSANDNYQNSLFLDPIHFGRPDRATAIPLIARGRTVAVLYVDNGKDGAEPAVDALEMLVRVAGLTVELHAAAPGRADEGSAGFGETHHPHTEEFSAFPPPVPAVPVEMEPQQPPPLVREEPPVTASDFSFSESVDTHVDVQERIEPAREFSFESHVTEAVEQAEPTAADIPFPEPSAVPSFEDAYPVEPMTGSSASEPSAVAESNSAPVVFESGGSIESAGFDRSPFDVPAEEYQPAPVAPMGGYAQVAETVAEALVVTPPPSHARLSDRPVDLPIDVPEEERRIHNDARRFARLLVSEIKLYNEKKVVEGRESGDLYDRLREAIDRSREMYDKRVQPPVAAKFDYFHYELVNSLADGDAARLGSGYPGPTI